MGAEVHSIMSLMGRTSINTTQKYLHASPQQLKNISGLLA